MTSHSAYSRKDKRPVQYSKLYQEWRAAVTAGDKERASALGNQHADANGVDRFVKMRNCLKRRTSKRWASNGPTF